MIKQFSSIKPKYEGKIELKYDNKVLQSDSKLMKLLKNVVELDKKTKDLERSIKHRSSMMDERTKELEWAYDAMSYNNVAMWLNDQRCYLQNDVHDLEKYINEYNQYARELMSALDLSQKLIAKYGDNFIEKIKDYTSDITELFAVSEQVITVIKDDNSCENYKYDINIDLIKYTSYYVPKPLSKMSLCFLVDMDIFNDDVINYINKHNLKEDISSWYIYRRHKLPPTNIIPRNPTSLKFIGCLLQIDPEFDLKSLYDRKMSFEFVSKLTDAFPEIDFNGLL